MSDVGIASPERSARAYPHELSGGMRQRVMIALGLANSPEILIADEPTTALDVTIQAQVLQVLRDMQREHGTAIILITHDLGVVSDVADRIAVMYAGRVVETGTRDQVLFRPRHPYTRGLLAAVPSLTGPVTGRLSAIGGNALTGVDRPAGCAFAARCDRVRAACSGPVPLLRRGQENGHLDACVAGEADISRLRQHNDVLRQAVSQPSWGRFSDSVGGVTRVDGPGLLERRYLDGLAGMLVS